MHSSTTTILLPGDASAVPRMVAAVERFCAEHRRDGALASRLSVVLEELLTNTIAYAYTDGGTHEISLTFEADASGVTVVYEDDGRAFDPFHVAAPDFDAPVEQWPIGRLGVHLVRYLTDRAVYARVGARNRITLHKSSRPAGGPAHV